MNDAVLLELAKRWEDDAKPQVAIDGSSGAEIQNAVDRGHRECKRECADTLRSLVELLGRGS